MGIEEARESSLCNNIAAFQTTVAFCITPFHVMVQYTDVIEAQKDPYRTSGKKLSRQPSAFANDESRKASFKRSDGDGSAAIAYLELHPETQELCCDDSLEPRYLEPLYRLLVQSHSFVHLHSLELPNNRLSPEAGPSLANVLHSQQQTLSKLDLSHNPLTAAGIESLMDTLLAESKLTILILTDVQLGSKGATTIASILRSKNGNNLRELYIGNNRIGPKGIKNISLELLKNTSLRVLDVSCNAIKSQGASALATALKNATESGLRTIDVSGNNLGPGGMKPFIDLLSVDRRLEGLFACRNDIGEEGARLLHEALLVNYTLKDLRLEGNNIGDCGTVMLAESLADDEHTTSALEKLALGYNNIGLQGAQSLSNLLQTNATLRHLDLTGNKICSTGAQTLAGSLSHNLGLEELLLTSNQIDDAGAYDLALAMGRSTCSLHKLICEDNHISDEGYTSLSRVPQLQRNQKYWLGPLLKDLSRGLPTSIDLTKRHIGDEELLLLTDVLASSSPVIRALYICGDRLSRRSLVPFCELTLGPQSNIMRLYLTKCDCGDEIAAAMSSSLRTNKSLQVLCLMDSSVSVVGASAIAEGLSGNSTLRRLNLDRNRISDLGMSALGSVLSKTSLQSLSVSKNSITDLSMDFEFAKCLQQLQLNGNPITDTGALVICRYLNADSSLVWLGLRHTALTSRGRDTIKMFLPTSAVVEF